MERKGWRREDKEDPLIRVRPVLLIYSTSIIRDRSFPARSKSLRKLFIASVPIHPRELTIRRNIDFAQLESQKRVALPNKWSTITKRNDRLFVWAHNDRISPKIYENYIYYLLRELYIFLNEICPVLQIFSSISLGSVSSEEIRFSWFGSEREFRISQPKQIRVKRPMAKLNKARSQKTMDLAAFPEATFGNV